MRISIIAAIAENKVIGKDNDLIWNLPKDMKFFKDTTEGKPVIMGRRNYDSIPEKYRPLPNRQNIILTRQEGFTAENCDVVQTLQEAIDIAEPKEEVFVIGGGQVYQLALEMNIVDSMYLTHIHESFDGDTFFPDFDESKWNKKVIMEHNADDKNPHSFTVYQYDKVI